MSGIQIISKHIKRICIKAENTFVIDFITRIKCDRRTPRYLPESRYKKIVAWAYEMRFIDRNVFASFRVKKNEFESPILNWQQLETLQRKIFRMLC